MELSVENLPHPFPHQTVFNFSLTAYNGSTNSAWDLESAFYLKTSFRVVLITPRNTQMRVPTLFFNVIRNRGSERAKNTTTSKY